MAQAGGRGGSKVWCGGGLGGQGRAGGGAGRVEGEGHRTVVLVEVGGMPLFTSSDLLQPDEDPTRLAQWAPIISFRLLCNQPPWGCLRGNG